MQHRRDKRRAPKCRFQSSPDPEVGCNGDGFASVVCRARVSILTRPGGRVQLQAQMATWAIQGFQSSPDPEVGCNPLLPANGLGYLGFNPHPTRRSGATPTTPPSPRVCYCFNPHPTRRSGATSTVRTISTATISFNPHPTRRSGATITHYSRSLIIEVSILTRPGGRVQPGIIPNQDSAQNVSILTRPGGRVQQVHSPYLPIN